MCIVILKDSDSIVCTPELFGTGAMREVMACTPCNVPAITRYSFDDSCAMPAVVGYGRTTQRYREMDARQYLTFSEVGRGKGLTPIIPLKDETARLVDDPDTIYCHSCAK
jgi:hypothetical protein